jgi:formamidopyrimidine-DNA glycosylase
VPELPEVETYARDLAAALVGRAFTGARTTWPRQMPSLAPAEFDARLRGQRVLSVGRRGKYLVFRLETDWLLVHLKMSGRFAIATPTAPADPLAHTILALDDGSELRFHDPRKFGRLYLTAQPHEILGRLGPDALSATTSLRLFADRLAARRRRLKPLLLDQTVVAGIGNIYADESLWRARLHPLGRADRISPPEVERLYWAVRWVLGRAIALRGTSLTRGGYRDLDGRTGRMRQALAVYGRTGKPCPRCGRAIDRLIVAGRGTHVCLTCQPPPAPDGNEPPRR